MAAVGNTQEEYVTLNMKLIDWSHMDFKRTLPTTTSIQTLKEIIKHHHRGSISSIVICKHSFEEKHELKNPNATLKDCGICNAPSVDLYYNFKTDEDTKEDPILMC
jgi:3-dehydroquinate dehydratase